MMILPNVLVMAEGVEIRAPNDSGAGKLNIQMITLAVDTEEALLLRMCQTANVQLSCILRSEEAGDNKRWGMDKWSKDGVKKWLQEQQESLGSFGGGDGGGTPRAVGDGSKVKLPVPTEDLPAGTEITVELVERKFKEVEFTAPAPENAIKDMKEHLGRYIVDKVYANQFVPRTAVGNKKDIGKVAPDGSSSPKVGGAPPDENTETFDRTITNGSVTRVYRYERKRKTKDEEWGDWKLVGEVKEDGSVVPVQGTAPPGKNPTAPPGKTDPQNGGDKPADPKLT
jgi:hypothetical protein